MSIPQLSIEQRRAATAALQLDPDRSNIVLCVGTKGSGKSEAARTIFDAYPYDRAVIDITGDARPEDPTTIALKAPFPASMPEPDPKSESPTRSTLWLRVDPRSATLEQDHDLAMNVGLYPRHRKALILIDEYGRAATASKIPPNIDLALMSSRHYALTLVLCCPRPTRIPVLTIEQADKILIFDTPNIDDRERLAKNMGYPFRRFEECYERTMHRESHAYLLWDKRQKVLLGCPPLPLKQTHGPRA